MNDLAEVKAIGSRVSKWGEGPIGWGNELFYVDIEGRAVVAMDLTTELEREWEVGQRVGFVVPCKCGNGRVLIGGDHGLFFLDLGTGELEAIADPEEDLAENRFNDGKCAPDGYLFAGTISLAKKRGTAGLYRLSPDLELSQVLDGVTNSNGLGWSPNGKRMYYIDTPTQSLDVFDYADGEISNRRQLADTSAVGGSPDGLAVDADGRIWVAFCHGACLVCFADETGEILGKIDLPCLETTAVAMVGVELERLIVTTGIHKTEVEALAGRLLEVEGLRVRGLPVNHFG